MSTQPIRVMLVDDHEVVRHGLRALIEAENDLVVCAEASSAAEAVRAAEETQPDVVVMDVRLGEGSGIDATRDIRASRPSTAVLILTSRTDEDALFASILAGASGYVLKRIRGNDLMSAIRSLAAGESLLDPAVTGAVLDRVRKRSDMLKDEKLARLSRQEARVLMLMAEGKSNKDIAAALHLAEKTVKNYVSSIFSKLEVGRRGEAAAYLARWSTPHLG